MRRFACSLAFVCTLGVMVPTPARADLVNKPVLVHYMPWYASKPVSGAWGWHWTMNHFDPDNMTEDGRNDIASHYHPLIGPYDSGDPDALECHVLLMKLAGIDGIIIDWYGIKDFRDYAEIHRNSRRLIEHVKKAGLKFTVCYEDQTIKHMVAAGVLSEREGLTHGSEVLRWLDTHWFADPAYVKVAGEPILLVFGPQHFNKQQWAKITAPLANRPRFYALPHLSEQAGADGVFGWPPVHGGKEIQPDAWRGYLRDLYARGQRGESVIASAFPKFHDIYKQAGLHDSYGYIDDRGGRTFTETLDLACQADADLIQIVTWNDYGEGTIIEPTTEFGYQYLEVLQKRRKLQVGSSFPFTAADLRLPVTLYKLRKQHQGDRAAEKELDKASRRLFSSDCPAAKDLLETRN